MRPSTCWITVFAVLFLAADVNAETTTVFLVRHAEKSISTDNNPSLSAAGQKRAQQLARTLRSVKLQACFVSQFKRTQQTAAPTATAANLSVIQRDAGLEAEVATEIKSDFAGKTVLFAGHSNTVPELLKHLGAQQVPTLSESDYDNLFLLSIHSDGSVTVTRLHYGAANPD